MARMRLLRIHTHSSRRVGSVTQYMALPIAAHFCLSVGPTTNCISVFAYRLMAPKLAAVDDAVPKMVRSWTISQRVTRSGATW